MRHSGFVDVWDLLRYSVLLLIAAGAFLYLRGLQSKRVTTYDEDMDNLSRRLNQNAIQYPYISQTSVYPFLPKGVDVDGGALQFYSNDVTPLAARWTSYALQYHATPYLHELKKSLIERWAWAWHYNGREHVGDANNKKIRGYFRSFVIQGYTNKNIPTDLSDIDMPLEHYHFCYFANNTSKYWGSYVVESKKLLGTQRLFILKHLVDGEPEVIDVYETLPTYNQALGNVKLALDSQIMPPEPITESGEALQRSGGRSSGNAGSNSALPDHYRPWTGGGSLPDIRPPWPGSNPFNMPPRVEIIKMPPYSPPVRPFRPR